MPDAVSILNSASKIPDSSKMDPLLPKLSPSGALHSLAACGEDHGEVGCAPAAHGGLNTGTCGCALMKAYGGATPGRTFAHTGVGFLVGPVAL